MRMRRLSTFDLVGRGIKYRYYILSVTLLICVPAYMIIIQSSTYADTTKDKPRTVTVPNTVPLNQQKINDIIVDKPEEVFESLEFEHPAIQDSKQTFSNRKLALIKKLNEMKAEHQKNLPARFRNLTPDEKVRKIRLNRYLVKKQQEQRQEEQDYLIKMQQEAQQRHYEREAQRSRPHPD